VQDELPVRKVEELARQAATEKPDAPRKTNKSNEDFSSFENNLSEFLKTNVQIKANDKGKGSISIPFKNQEELETLLEIFEKLK
jgi:ParB family chromosome partitioning protein